ncbi:MAG TPA: hypothetical protein VE912_17135 [Bacteroidales bacterium]|nr:hypothetical protein [Bacteroidales bacterium]
MNNISIKYNLLSSKNKKEINDFMDFLLNRQLKKNSTSMAGYKKKILSVSTWSENDIQIFNENKNMFNAWKIEEW